MPERDPIDANAGDDKKNNRKKEKKGGLLGKLIITFTLLAFILLIAVLGFDFLGMRERYLRGVIDGIPIINTMFPAPLSVDDGGEPINLMTKEELMSQLKVLQDEVDSLNKEKENMAKRIGIYTAEIENLKEIELQHEQFRRDKNEFDELVAMRDPAAYVKFYESISPENADSLYRDAIDASERVRELKRLTNTVSSMDETASARMLEALMTTDMDLVVMMLKNINTNISGLIIESMSSENAAAVIKRMAPSG